MNYSPVCRALVALSMSASMALATPLEVKPLPTVDSSLPVIRWLPNADVNYWSEAPLYKLTEPGVASAKGWVALSESHLLLRVVVDDADPIRKASKWDLWQNDGLQIAIDGQGNGTDGMAEGTAGVFGRDDMALGLALTPEGPLGWLFFTGNKELASGALPSDWFAIVEDAASHQITYTLRVPWSVLATKPGVNPCFGIAVQVNDSHAEGRAQSRLYYGRGADGQPRPGLHQKLAVGVPEGPYAAALVTQSIIWSDKEPATAVLASHSTTKTSFTASIGTDKLNIESAKDTGWQRWQVRFVPGSANAGAAQIRKADAANEPLVEFTPVVADTVYADFIKQLDGLISTSEHPLFTRHLQSVKSLTMTEWARMGVYRAQDSLSARVTLERIQSMARGFASDAGQWESYLNGKRSMVLAYKSPYDGTLQYYLFGVPKDWDSSKAYPFFFELHGAGDDNPLGGVAAKVGITEGAPSLHGYSAPKVFAEIQRNGYWCEPFGRGNLGYRGIGETDVLEAYADVHANFKIDPDRRYLYGFSMGGGGTWSIGLRTPDRWAAMHIFAGGVWREPEGLGLANNIKHMPIRIWCGEADALYAQVPFMKAELEEAGIQPVMASTPELGHSYRSDIQETGVNWLQQFTRQRPKSFSFRADTDTLRSAWGITLERNVAVSGLPRYTCTIDGQTVTITSEGAPSLEVLPGAEGLGMSGEIKLIWNGKEVYSGAIQPLRLKEGKATPFDPSVRSRGRGR